MSAPSGPIQSAMPGFLSLLNLKNKGLLPDTLMGNVQPVIEVGGYFIRSGLSDVNQAASRLVPISSVRGYQVFTTGISPTVPANQWWYVEWATLKASANAVNAVLDTFALAFRIPGGTDPFYVISESGSISAANPSRVVSASGFWMPPGAVLGFYAGDITVAGVDFTLTGLRFASFLV